MVCSFILNSSRDQNDCNWILIQAWRQKLKIWEKLGKDLFTKIAKGVWVGKLYSHKATHEKLKHWAGPLDVEMGMNAL